MKVPVAKGLARALVLLAGGATLGVFGLAWFVHRFGRRDGSRRAQVIVVLGARVHPDGTPSGSLSARVEHAVALFQRGLAPWVLFSGGALGGSPAEAQVARALAVRAGVPEAACLVEDQSRSTRENAARCASLLAARGLTDALVVTDPYHLFRARQWFRRSGLEVGLSPASLEGRGMSRTELSYWVVREALGLLLRPALLFARSKGSKRSNGSN